MNKRNFLIAAAAFLSASTVLALSLLRAAATNSGDTTVPIGPAELPGVVGETEWAALTFIRRQGLKWRVVARDGQPFPVNADYHPNRVNLTVQNGVVTAATFG